MSVSNPNLTIVEADVTDTDTLKEAGKGKDAVISAYNPGWKNPHIYEDTLKNYPLIVESVKQAGVKRLLIVGGAGTLFYAPGKMVMDADDVPAQLLPGIKSLGEFYLNTLRRKRHRLDIPLSRRQHDTRQTHRKVPHRKRRPGGGCQRRQ